MPIKLAAKVTSVFSSSLGAFGSAFAGPEASARSVGRAEIEWRSDYGDIRLPRVELLRRRQQRSLGEGLDRAEGVALVELFLVAGGEVALGICHGRAR